MNFYQQLVKQKLKTITPEELAAYSRDYGLPITVSQAKKILHLARTNDLNVFDPQERKKWVRELAKITSPEIAKKANELFLQFVQKKVKKGGTPFFIARQLQFSQAIDHQRSLPAASQFHACTVVFCCFSPHRHTAFLKFLEYPPVVDDGRYN